MIYGPLHPSIHQTIGTQYQLLNFIFTIKPHTFSGILLIPSHVCVYNFM